MLEYIEKTWTIVLKSGLHIGAGDTEMRIGGTDNPVVKHPHTNEPYIPGSSIKGKVRSLLEIRSGLMDQTNGNCLTLKDYKKLPEGDQKETCKKILMLFGSSGSDKNEMEDIVKEIGPGRVSFADCPLEKNWREEAAKNNWQLTEVKSENMINRIKGTAEHPRFTERVPANARFEFRFTLKKLAGDGDELADLLFQGLNMLQKDSLGGSGSRGYGRIEFDFGDDVKSREKFEALT